MGISELEEQLETPEEAGVSIKQIAQQTMNENGQKMFEIFWQREEDVCIVSRARWNAQLKGLAELEKRCQGMMHDERKTRSSGGHGGRQDQVAE